MDAQRAAEILTRKGDGETWRSIAVDMGISVSTAKRMAKAAKYPADEVVKDAMHTKHSDEPLTVEKITAAREILEANPVPDEGQGEVAWFAELGELDQIRAERLLCLITGQTIPRSLYDVRVRTGGEGKFAAYLRGTMIRDGIHLDEAPRVVLEFMREQRGSR